MLAHQPFERAGGNLRKGAKRAGRLEGETVAQHAREPNLERPGRKSDILQMLIKWLGLKERADHVQRHRFGSSSHPGCGSKAGPERTAATLVAEMSSTFATVARRLVPLRGGGFHVAALVLLLLLRNLF